MDATAQPPRTRQTGKRAYVDGNILKLFNKDDTEKDPIPFSDTDKVVNGNITTITITDPPGLQQNQQPKITNKYVIDTTTGNYTLNKKEIKEKDSKKEDIIDADNKKLNYGINTNSDTLKQENQDLLEIFDKGINDIVLRLKARFGSNNTEVNEVVKAISQVFTGIDTKISTGTGNISNDDYGTNQLISTKDTNGKYTSNIINKHVEMGDLSDTNNPYEKLKDPSYIPKYLDDNTKNYQATLSDQEINMSSQDDVNKLKFRLNNCQALEILHLKLFENFMSTGAFTLTLYEKYKYVTQVMLYLLKNLVNKPKLTTQEMIDSGCADSSDRIKLPKTIIKNIASLVEEQDKIQNTINSIRTGLSNTQLDKIYNLGSEQMNTNIENNNTPDQQSDRNGTPLPDLTDADKIKTDEIKRGDALLPPI